MSLETIIQKTKKAVIAAALPLALFSSMPVQAQNTRSTTNNYRVDAETLNLGGPIFWSDIPNFAEAQYTVEESGNDYVVKGSMNGLHNLYRSRMNVTVEGTKVNGKYMPRHYEMVYTDNTAASSDGTTTTRIDFDYNAHVAYANSFRVKDGRRRELYNTRPNGVTIDNTVKDMLSGIMDLRSSRLNSSMPINTIISGQRVTYNAHYEGRENTNYLGQQVPCNKFTMVIPARVIDSNRYVFTFWITQSRSHTPLRMRIQPGRSSLMALLSGTTRR